MLQNVMKEPSRDDLYPSEIKMQDLAPGNYRLSEIPENLPFVVASPQRSLRYRS